MAPRDDDKALDGLIRRSLMRQPPGSDCPEPDILAAYQDGSLDNEEIARHELHFSECSRCREQLAVMARAGAEVEIPVHMEVAAFAKAAPTVAAPASLEPRARRRSWLFDWRWLAPVAAVVVFAAVVYMRLTPPVQKFAQLGDQIAQSKRATAPAAPAKQLEDAYQQVPAPSAPATQPPPPVARHAATAATPGPAGAEQDRSLPNKESRTGQRGPTREEQERRRALIQRLEEQRLSSSLENEPGKSAADAGAEMDRMMASGRNAGAPAQHAAAAAPRPGPPAATSTLESDEKNGAMNESVTVQSQAPAMKMSAKIAKAPAIAPAESKPAAPAIGTAHLDKAKLSSSGPLIKSPDPAVMYRIASGGFVERTADSGETWQGQLVDSRAQLIAGAAPAVNVCWLAGREAAIYVTNDGKNWKKNSPPAQVDFVAITATDASSATVTAIDGRKFSTTDGGKTWALVM